MKLKKIPYKTIIKTVILGIFAFLFLLPLFWMLSASLKTPVNVLDYPIEWIPKDIQWKNYARIWTNEQMPFTRVYMNSLFVAFFSLLGQLAFASMAAFAFAKLDFKGKNIVFMALLASMMIPTESTIIPCFMLFKTLGLYNHLSAIILPTWFNVSTIFMLRQFYYGLPNDLMEAAKIDGAGFFRIWGQVYLPLTKPALVSAGILGFISTWNAYLPPLIYLVDKKKYTISLGIRFWLVDDAREYNMMMAAAASAIVPMIILVIACQKYFVEGIAMAGMKE
jgi:multiple sugar transport system permease protein